MNRGYPNNNCKQMKYVVTRMRWEGEMNTVWIAGECDDSEQTIHFVCSFSAFLRVFARILYTSFISSILTILISFSTDCDFSTMILFITNVHYSHSFSNLLTSWPISVLIILRRIVFIEVVVNWFFNLSTSSWLLK